MSCSYDSVIDSVVNSNVKFEDLLEGVTNLVEHPIQMKAPSEWRAVFVKKFENSFTHCAFFFFFFSII